MTKKQSTLAKIRGHVRATGASPVAVKISTITNLPTGTLGDRRIAYRMTIYQAKWTRIMDSPRRATKASRAQEIDAFCMHMHSWANGERILLMIREIAPKTKARKQ